MAKAGKKTTLENGHHSSSVY